MYCSSKNLLYTLKGDTIVCRIDACLNLPPSNFEIDLLVFSFRRHEGFRWRFPAKVPSFLQKKFCTYSFSTYPSASSKFYASIQRRKRMPPPPPPPPPPNPGQNKDPSSSPEHFVWRDFGKVARDEEGRNIHTHTSHTHILLFSPPLHEQKTAISAHPNFIASLPFVIACVRRRLWIRSHTHTHLHFPSLTRTEIFFALLGG